MAFPKNSHSRLRDATSAAITGKQLVRSLEKVGFGLVRTKAIIAHLDGRRVTIPVHAGRDMLPGTLRSVLTDANLGVDELLKLL